MELTVETKYIELTPVEQQIEGVSIAVLQGRWKGDKIVLEQGDAFHEEVLMPTGMYVTGEKEYHVVDGIVTDIWGVPDENQLTLF